jgi:hypothetical protein
VTLTRTGAGALADDELGVQASSGALYGGAWPTEVTPGTSVRLTHSDGWDGQTLVMCRAASGDRSAVVARVTAPSAGG